jgi:hypothetical protein
LPVPTRSSATREWNSIGELESMASRAAGLASLAERSAARKFRPLFGFETNRL